MVKEVYSTMAITIHRSASKGKDFTIKAAINTATIPANAMLSAAFR